VTTVTLEALSADGLISVQVMVARIACRWKTEIFSLLAAGAGTGMD
jgi:hypothetical protein